MNRSRLQKCLCVHANQTYLICYQWFIKRNIQTKQYDFLYCIFYLETVHIHIHIHKSKTATLTKYIKSVAQK